MLVGLATLVFREVEELMIMDSGIVAWLWLLYDVLWFEAHDKVRSMRKDNDSLYNRAHMEMGLHCTWS